MSSTVDKSWVEGPVPLVHTPIYETKKNNTFTTGASHMALMHNAVFRGFNSIYNQALSVPAAQHANFIGYASAWTKLVISHAEAEERDLFPHVEAEMKKPGYFDDTLGEHEAFVSGVQTMSDYLHASAQEPASFKPQTLRDKMDAFLEPFQSHFHSEIKTIAALAAGPEPTEKAAKAFEDWGRTSITNAGYTDVFVFLLLHMDREFEDGLWMNWPPIPGLVKMGLANVFMLRHPGWWQFASSDTAGNVKPMKMWA
ncbi:hypothetical protein P152DRAFT_406137 [Eremomyces bilateralis CBS 781.70]|uniref:Hemerythrin-like domain-containing protein n=1 Tax=Eremomyces bilateralis CBS 781.70 TaxID=1392243 RepID=A0A6G1FQY1_9PEZI|nr:uncharacterized protein P152DRAFT_406137 [Eremomyces bilateralis CBS 781.70]KAF1808091.1 hypothetical protein P152DRAFT_406137 [Eremomyces bilateralis CBS 781.70]